MLKRIVKSKSIVYLVGELFSKLSPFLALPLLTRVLSPEEFAIYSLFVISVFFTYILSSLATASYIPIVFFKNQENLIKTLKTVISISSAIGLSSSLILIFVFMFVKNFDNYFVCALGAVMVGYLSVFNQVKLSIYQCEKKAFQYVTLNIVRNLIFLFLVVFGYISAFSTSDYFIISYAISYVLITPFIIISILRKFGTDVFKFKIDMSVIRFGLPSIPNALANWAKTSVDRYFILFSLGAIQLGFYSAAYQLAFGAMVISGALVKAMSPNLFLSLKERGYDSYVKSYCIKYFMLYLAISILYCLVLYFLSSYLLGDNYSGTNIYSSLLVLSAIFQGSASFFIGVLFYNDKVQYSLYCNIVSLLVHIALLGLIAIFSAPIEYYIYSSIFSSFIYFLLIIRATDAFHYKSS